MSLIGQNQHQESRKKEVDPGLGGVSDWSRLVLPVDNICVES